jgi:hypothetical protein
MSTIITSELETMLRRAIEPLASQAQASFPESKVRLLKANANQFVFVYVSIEDGKDGTLVAGLTFERCGEYRIRGVITVDDWGGVIDVAETSTTVSLGPSPQEAAIKAAIEETVTTMVASWDAALHAFARREAATDRGKKS